MIRSTLARALAEKHPELNEMQAQEIVNDIFELKSKTLVEGRRIEIRDFGSFSVKYIPPKDAYNPKTREKIITRPKYRVQFKAGKELREALIEAKKQGVPLREDNSSED